MTRDGVCPSPNIPDGAPGFRQTDGQAVNILSEDQTEVARGATATAFITATLRDMQQGANPPTARASLETVAGDGTVIKTGETIDLATAATTYRLSVVMGSHTSAKGGEVARRDGGR